MKFDYRWKDENINDTIIVNEPIHGEIEISEPFVSIIFTKEMQRLADITQNGFKKIDFPGLADNNRLNHSIGTFYIMRRILDKLSKELAKLNVEISQDDKDLVLCAMLLHDIGHGPYSHTSEQTLNFNHEEQTRKILLGDTEVNKVLKDKFGEEKLIKIASYIFGDTGEITENSFSKLLKNLISYIVDVDKYDYLIRDAIFAGFKSLIDLNRIIESITATVDTNQEYRLLIKKKALSCFETVLISRYQMYRDVYLPPNAMLGNYLYEKILDRYRDNPDLHGLPVQEEFKYAALNRDVSDLNIFLKLTETVFEEAFEIFRNNISDPLIAFMSKFSNFDEDYITLPNNVCLEKIKQQLKNIFSNCSFDFDNMISLIKHDIKVKLIKEEEMLYILESFGIRDISEISNLIRAKTVLEDTYIRFSPELLRLEMRLSVDEFEEYREKLDELIETLMKKQEEFELKYTWDDEYDIGILKDELIQEFERNGYELCLPVKSKKNIDEYYENYNMGFYNNGESLRVRETNNDGKVEYEGTYKRPKGTGTTYSERYEFEFEMEKNDFSSLTNGLNNKSIPVSTDAICPVPILNVETNRRDLIFKKNGKRFCLSLDKSIYTNHFLDNTMVTDKMIEIEAKDDVVDRIMLNEINSFIAKKFVHLKLITESKYTRGINKTYLELMRLTENSIELEEYMRNLMLSKEKA